MSGPTLLVVAKAPVPGRAKTRVAATVGDETAARVAAAALLDTLAVVVSTGRPVVVAMTGSLDDAAESAALREALTPLTVVPQRGDGLGERLGNAHADADAGHGVVQIGMDTPQVTAADLDEAAAGVAAGRTVLGHAVDGGWWLLGLPDPSAATVLRDVPMSTDETGRLTEAALPGPALHLRMLRDLDTWDDAVTIAAGLPGSRTAAEVLR